jgi:uncharacterized protein YggE
MTGNGKVTAIPDIAILRLGVQTTGENLTSVQTENARISQAVLQALEEMGVTEIQTYQYLIDKVYEFENGRRIDQGYSVRNIFEIRTANMNQVGALIDTAVYFGANVVDFINFEVSDANAYYLKALNMAVMNAYQKAKSISLNQGLMMDPVPIRIVESTTTPIPYSQFFTAREGSLTTPIEPGNKQIEASVTVDFIF